MLWGWGWGWGWWSIAMWIIMSFFCVWSVITQDATPPHRRSSSSGLASTEEDGSSPDRRRSTGSWGSGAVDVSEEEEDSRAVVEEKSRSPASFGSAPSEVTLFPVLVFCGCGFFCAFPSPAMHETAGCTSPTSAMAQSCVQNPRRVCSFFMFLVSCVAPRMALQL